MLFYFACEAAGASSARHSLRPLMFQTRKLPAKLARMRGEIAEVCVVGCLKCKRGVIAHERATLPAVIVRESGRSSIPEKVVMESKSRGVLDHPLSRVMTATDSNRMASMPLVHSPRLRSLKGEG
jgi:hypothetical protein